MPHHLPHPTPTHCSVWVPRTWFFSATEWRSQKERFDTQGSHQPMRMGVMANAVCPWEGGCRGQTSQLYIRSPVGPSQVSPYCTFYSLFFLPCLLPNQITPFPEQQLFLSSVPVGLRGVKPDTTTCFRSQWLVQGCCTLLCEPLPWASSWGILSWPPLALIFTALSQQCSTRLPDPIPHRQETRSQAATWLGALSFVYFLCLTPALNIFPSLFQTL